MGFLNGLLGNASETNVEEVVKEYGHLLTSTESIEKAYKLIRDLYIFTNKRLIMVDVQGVTGKKIEYHSIPYKSIIHFSIETAGHLDLDAELRIWVSGLAQPFQKQFNKNLNIYEIQSVLADYVLK